MSSRAAPGPSPADALERAFGAVARGSMRGLPVGNPALSVEAIGFTRVDGDWFGAMILPWSLLLLRVPVVAQGGSAPVDVGSSVARELPAGEIDFLGARIDGFGACEQASLLSPMTPFASQHEARETALHVLASVGLRTVGPGDGGDADTVTVCARTEVPVEASLVQACAGETPALVSRRGFFGLRSRP